MAKYLVRICLFLLPLLLLGFTMEVLLRHIPNDYQSKHEYLKNNSNQIETLILGNSHAFFGVDPAYFTTKAYNASQFSQPLLYDFEVLKQHQDNLENLKTVIIPISYLSLFMKLENHEESWRILNYVLYYDMNLSFSLHHHFEIFNRKLSVNYRKIKSYYISKKSNIKSNEMGFFTFKTKKENSFEDLEKAGQKAAKRHTFDLMEETHQKTYQENVTVLKSILQWGEERGVHILFFTPPAFKTYRENLNEHQLHKTIETVKKITEASSNSFYINLLNDKSFDFTDFHDADHLSKTGSKKLSQRLNSIITSWDKK